MIIAFYVKEDLGYYGHIYLRREEREKITTSFENNVLPY
jgi:hypothetical protein